MVAGRISYTHIWNLINTLFCLSTSVLIAAYIFDFLKPYTEPFIASFVDPKSTMYFLIGAVSFFLIFLIPFIPISFLTNGIDAFLYFKINLGIPISLKEARQYACLIEPDDNGNWDNLDRIKEMPKAERKNYLLKLTQGKKY